MEHRNQNEGPNGMNCADFDARLADALDGVMSGAELKAFKMHAEACADCGPLFTQTLHGMESLRSLAAFELDPPANLVHNIVARTSMIDPKMSHALAASGQRSWLGRARGWAAPVFDSGLRIMAQPRLAMTAAMAFFSVSLVLNLAGVKMTDIRHVDLRPSALTTTASVQYHQTTARVVKYYENIRFVYELESRMKELTKDSPRSDDKNNNPKRQRKEDNTSHNPETNQNYRADNGEEYLAMIDSSTELFPAHGRFEHDRGIF